MSYHEKMNLCCDIDKDPPQHWAICECGYQTARDEELMEVLALINNHKAYRDDLVVKP